MTNLCTITASKYVHEPNGNASVKNVEYLGNIQTDGFIYFNDETFYRLDFTDYQNAQLFYIPKQIWIKTDQLTDIQVKGFSTNGGTALPPGGEGVEAAVLWAINIANDDSHGYDQITRDGGVDFDCSSLTSWAFREAGYDIPLPSPATYTMIDPFVAAGAQWLSGIGNDSSELYRGDILLNINSHVAIYIGDGQLVEAATNEFGGNLYGQPGDQTGQEIRVGGFYSFPWDGVLRFS